MCFSATASFASAAILGVAGIASIKKTQSANQLVFASVPILFAVQQLAEGFVWLSHSGMDQPAWHQWPVTFFLSFALVIWPLCVPIASLLIETNNTRKLIQYICLGLGVVFSVFTTFYLFTYDVSASISNYHVYCNVEFPHRRDSLTSLFYFGATVIPLIASSHKGVPALGLLIFASYMITKYFYGDYVISVWCFFAALSSGVIYLLVANKIKSFNSGSVPANT